MRTIIFDIETQNTFAQVGKNDASLLDISIVVIYDSETNKYHSFWHDELDGLWSILEQADLLVGYNSIHFDLPLLNKYYLGNLEHIAHLDILVEVQKSFGRRVKLDQIAAGTLGTKKSGHGLDAVKWWRRGELDKIKKYCINDVIITKKIYDYALEKGHLIIKTGPEKFVVEINTSDWGKKDNTTMTQSLF